MKNLRLQTLSFFSLIFLFAGCTQHEFLNEEPDPTPEIKFPLVEDELKPYFQRFEDEATLLGLAVDLTVEGIRGRIEDIDDGNIAGQCSYGHRGSHLVTIDSDFWHNSSDLFKEFIVFHELGHCYLGRDHLETAFSNGICKSIMRSGTGFCLDYYRRDTRDYYIEELFFPKDGAPEITL